VVSFAHRAPNAFDQRWVDLDRPPMLGFRRIKGSLAVTLRIMA
jgi:hypothetical protein